MGFLDDLLSAVTSNLPIGRMSLRDATKNAPRQCCGGELLQSFEIRIDKQGETEGLRRSKKGY